MKKRGRTASVRLGVMLAETPKNGGAKGVGKSVVNSNDRTPTLAALGITKDLSSRAERRLGVMLKDGENRAKPGQYQQESPPPTLAALGITKDLSSRAQTIAAIPEPEFERTLSEHREAQEAVTGPS